MKTATKTKTTTDKLGRVWIYNDAEGSWTCGEHVIGCGRKNGSKWQIWDGADKWDYEYTTLRNAMADCR